MTFRGLSLALSPLKVGATAYCSLESTGFEKRANKACEGLEIGL
jgi:hypothetical protein